MAPLRPAGYWRSVGELGTLGLSFVIALAIGTGAGLWADDRFDTSPWGLLVGFGLGFAAAILNVYRITSRALASSRPAPRPSNGARPDA
jgi:F0F1-type ATP synthase assembly protein I